MQVSFTSLESLQKNFKPLNIVGIRKIFPYAVENYVIKDTDGVPIGLFSFDPKEGLVDNLKINQKCRGKKTAVNALLSIKEFVINKAKELNLDYLTCYAYKTNPNNVIKLYQHMGAQIADNAFITRLVYPLKPNVKIKPPEQYILSDSVAFDAEACEKMLENLRPLGSL